MASRHCASQMRTLPVEFSHQERGSLKRRSVARCLSSADCMMYMQASEGDGSPIAVRCAAPLQGIAGRYRCQPKAAHIREQMRGIRHDCQAAWASAISSKSSSDVPVINSRQHAWRIECCCSSCPPSRLTCM